ncbi:putative ATP-dependent RNA helicase DHX37 [Platysternon megacephalum]|uniref:Putative ATP-dependent RNA helicase DHX37 n=1 Tax=Platysternon megacephalum TaxID=55544 RepID=A0A4D9F491_9SAUR|nr:putative ATP-dependent RNA helicase DHX37 [Platysternon megacephalum]
MTPGGIPGIARNCWAGALIVAIALRTHRAHCTDPPEHFLLQEKSECHYTNGMQRVRYLKRLIWGQQEICYYDSDLGFSVARTELGRPIAEYWNRLELLSYLWASVEKFCSYNHRRFKNITVGRRVKPRVKISTLKAESSDRPSLLVCSATGFYPSKIATKWFKNGQEETAEVVSRELLHNGDWTFQIQVTLETKPRWGDVYTCQVEHISLQTPITMQWVAQPDSAKSKMLIGIVGFVVGLSFMVLGLLIYQKNKKGYSCLDTAESQAAGSDRGSSTNLLLCA